MVVLPEILKPDVIKVDESQVYIVEGIKIYIYAKNDLSLKKIFGKSGTQKDKFRLNDRGRKKVVIDVQSDVVLVNSYERISFFSKDGSFLKMREAIAQTDYYQKAGNKLVATNFFWEKNHTHATESIILCDDKLKPLGNLYKTSSGCGRQLRLMRGKKAKYNLFQEYFDFKVRGNHIYIADSSKGLFISVFDLEGNKEYDINNPYEQIRIPKEEKEKREEEVKGESIWKYREYLELICPKYYPAFKEFWVAGNFIYVNTYQKQGNKQKIMILDLKGKLVREVYVPNVKHADLFDNQFFYLRQNRDQEWELYCTRL
jgi:hypothetical protein